MDTERKDLVNDAGKKSVFELAESVRCGRVNDIVDAIEIKGVDVNEPLEDGSTMLMTAAEFGQNSACTVLLHYSADCAAKDEKGETAFLRAVKHGHPEVIKSLLAHGASVDDADNKGRSTVHWAAKRGDRQIMSFLISNGARIDSKDAKGRTPLVVAARCRSSEACGLLVEAGACLDPGSSELFDELTRTMESGISGYLFRARLKSIKQHQESLSATSSAHQK